VGLQLIGNYFDEATLLQTAHALQQATDFHTRAPAGFMEPPSSLRSQPPEGTQASLGTARRET
jgi:aspartyl-tRNA(Asn)/glutamyl-tRNA(Gln) amidotransferase subunit A